MALADSCFLQAAQLPCKDCGSFASLQLAARFHIARPLAVQSLSHRRSLLLGSVASTFCSRATQSADVGPLFDARKGSQSTQQWMPIEMDSKHPPTFVSAPQRRIIAIGDLHGDINQTRRALILAGLLTADGSDTWCGDTAVLVQVGDILDRGGDEIAILSLLKWLNVQAQLKGGAVFQVNGNHETINVEEDFRYVDPLGFLEAENFVNFCEQEHKGNYEAAFAEWRVVSHKRKSEKYNSPNWMPWNLFKMQKAMAARSFLFRQGGPLAKELARHGVVLRVNDWLFAHGGIHPHHVEYGLARMNKEVSEWMMGVESSSETSSSIPFIATRGYDSVVWSRLYSREMTENSNETIKVCAVLKAALQAAGAKGLVVGHTPQILGANCKCEGQVWRIDVGMSSGMLNAQPEVLEIFNDKVRVLSKSSQSSWLMGNDVNGSVTSAGQYTAI
ncbi:hypothetical protein KP509_01G106400 [Ceratopteris richardii]|uniref:Calcineurin-like phosphoesterase domain-containing protein n=1 Tax=Ceratopteris richardii TaxID=49495 RepID=A0A8T2VPF5_CERRI|nr:hypothetical protein KP509_01G106400 [Ceratopteris richardii]